MATRIILRFPSRCRECGAHLPEGTEAKYYGRGKVYGIGCHSRPATLADQARAVPAPADPGLAHMTDVDRQWEDWAAERTR